MSLGSLFKKAITGGEWHVAYSTGPDCFSLAIAPDKQWCADPFVFERDGEHYIFVEQYLSDKDKGCIGYYEFENGIPMNKGIIIENSYHMSYPDVFEYEGNIYMIPESSANNSVDLYRADHFPDKWHLVNSLISGNKYVDSTVYFDSDHHYLISYSIENGYEVHIFNLDLNNYSVELVSKKKYEKNVARPAGRLFWEDNKLIRPAQDCSSKYGEAIILYQVDSFNNNGAFEEHAVRRIDSERFGVANNPERVHQITFDSKYSVIDVYKEKLDLFHLPRIFFRSKRK